LKIGYPLGISFYALLNISNFKQTSEELNVFDEDIYEIKGLSTIRTIRDTLDENYAKDFYEKYYKEKEKNKSENGENLTEARDMLDHNLKILINEEEDENLPSKRDNTLILNNQNKIENVVVTISSSKEDIIPLKFDNTHSIENISSFLYTQRIMENESKEKSGIDSNNININNNDLYLDYEEGIPIEIKNVKNKNNKKQKIIIPITPRKDKNLKFKFFNSNNHQNTIKCSFKPKKAKYINK